MLDQRLLITLSEKDKERLEALARANTSGNLSALIRSLINRAYMMPSELGLLPPESFPNAPTEEPIRTLESERISM